jgi:hypothetical protein
MRRLSCGVLARPPHAALHAADRAQAALGRTRGECATQAALLRDVLGNPFRRPPPLPAAIQAWNYGTVVKLAKAVYDGRAFDRMPILADALEEAGCDNADIRAHCRGPGPHVRGCWVVDLLLARQ